MTALEYVKLRQGEKIGIAPVPTRPLSGSLVAPTWDQIKNAAVLSLCGWPATTLVNGVDPTRHHDDGGLVLYPTLSNGQPGLVSGIPSALGPLTAVVGNCNAGGVGWPDQILYFAHGAVLVGVSDMFDGPWKSLGLNGPGRGPVESITAASGELNIVMPAERLDDTSCCPSARVNVRAGFDSVTPVVRSISII